MKDVLGNIEGVGIRQMIMMTLLECVLRGTSEQRDNSEGEVANQMQDQKRLLDEGWLEVNFEG